MKKEVLQQKLSEQQSPDFTLQGDQLILAMELIDNIVEVNAKIKNLNQYIETYKSKLKHLMEESNTDILYSAKGRASLSITDITKIDHDKVRAILDEFKFNGRTTLSLSDISVIHSQQTFRVSPVNVGDEDE